MLLHYEAGYTAGYLHTRQIQVIIHLKSFLYAPTQYKFTLSSLSFYP